ncbi:hypothetical protein AMATHDRAFT_71920, partial [Amanita thiersii Skay4041]
MGYEVNERQFHFRVIEQQSLQIQRLQQKLVAIQHHVGSESDDDAVTTDPPSYTS